MSQKIIENCKKLIEAYEGGELGYMQMPEDSKPDEFQSVEERLVYYTLPMSLNYQRNSYTLWASVLETYHDDKLQKIFSIDYSAGTGEDELRGILTKYKIALQPNKHIHSWSTISRTIYANWGSISQLLEASHYDFLELKDILQKQHKKGFPYLSGPKIFNYWCYILSRYCDVNLQNSEYIEIAPDTHVKQCSVKLGVITCEEAENIDTQAISERWREVLQGTGINPIDMHSPLWFWSRNKFIYEL